MIKIVCNRQGSKKNIAYDTLKDPNNKTCIRTSIRVKFEEYVRMKVNKDKKIIYDMSNVNMGPSTPYKYMKESGDDWIGFIGERDEDFVIEKFKKKNDYLQDFSFDYSVGSNRELTGLFWADEEAQQNYFAFGDVAFDANYRTNRLQIYVAVVPFTGIGNHKQCIIFGVELLSSESIESYSWLLHAFKKANCNCNISRLLNFTRSIGDIQEYKTYIIYVPHILYNILKILYNKSYGKKRCFEKLFKSDQKLLCSLFRFELMGILCQHCFYVLRMESVESYPKAYLTKRWTKDKEVIRSVIQELEFAMDFCINRLVNDFDKLILFRDEMNEKMTNVDKETKNAKSMKNKEVIETLMRVEQQEKIKISPPTLINNKGGRRTKKIMKENKEIAPDKAKNDERKYHECGKYIKYDASKKHDCDIPKFASILFEE
uniref:MULE transposase domain-containing protein n=1 Tax=Lactuca sativa TaxID=4236 RepID=A0A9R1WKE9_LACSA|nr:hypothetical protein LSAT_V11C100038470 [Lactuca sativa]